MDKTPKAGRATELFARRIGYDPAELDAFREGGHRTRHVEQLARVGPRHSIEVEVVHSRHCNSGHEPGQKIVLDADGNLITHLCPRKVCVYLVSQLVIPVALINERWSEGLDPNDFHFMRQAKCLDAGVECRGYGEVRVKIQAVPRIQG